MASFSLVLWKYRQNRHGEYPIFLRITENRKHRYVKTEISVLKKHWNENTEKIRKNHPNDTALNNQLQRILTEAKNTELELKDKPKDRISAENLKKEIQGDKRRDFKRFAKRFINRLDERDQFWQWKKVRVVVSKITEFHEEKHHGGPLYFEEITPQFIEDFETWLKIKKGNNLNTRYKNLSVFRRVIRQAVKEKVIPAADNPFLNMKLKQKKVRKKKLTFEEIQKIEKVELPERSGVWHARNYFLFSFYSAGVRFGDLACLKWQNIQDGRLKYKMNKTDKWKNVKILPEAQRILDSYRPDIVNPDAYIFPLLDNNIKYTSDRDLKRQISSCNVIVNKDLKKLMTATEIETNISFHIARHSFADYARNKKMSVYAISKALGHSSLTITEQYLKEFDEEQVDDEMDQLFKNKKN